MLLFCLQKKINCRTAIDNQDKQRQKNKKGDLLSCKYPSVPV